VAEPNGIVVVYPQGCWDLWGYTDEDYANRNGPQIRGINSLIDAFARSALIDLR